MTPQPGTAQRAFLAWRTTASAMLPFWALLPLGTPYLVANASNEGFGQLAFVVLAMLSFAVGVLVVLPLFVFTIGRWIDRRTAPRGLRNSLMTFGIYGLGFAIVLMWLLLPSGLGPLGIVVMLLVPTLAAVLGRLLVELKGMVWTVLLWLSWAFAIAIALAMLGTIFLSGA